MLQTLLAITINGPKVGTSECDSLMTAAVELWKSQKKRRKLPRDRDSHLPVTTRETANIPVPAASISTATAAAVQTEQDQLESANVSHLASTVVDEVAVATTLLNLATDSNSFIDEGIYSDSKDSEEEGIMYF